MVTIGLQILSETKSDLSLSSTKIVDRLRKLGVALTYNRKRYVGAYCLTWFTRLVQIIDKFNTFWENLIHV